MNLRPLATAKGLPPGSVDRGLAALGAAAPSGMLGSLTGAPRALPTRRQPVRDPGARGLTTSAGAGGLSDFKPRRLDADGAPPPAPSLNAAGVSGGGGLVGSASGSLSGSLSGSGLSGTAAGGAGAASGLASGSLSTTPPLVQGGPTGSLSGSGARPPPPPLEGQPPAEEVGLYPIVTLQCSSTTLYQVSYHIR